MSRYIDADALDAVLGIGCDCANCQIGREKCEEDWMSMIEICGTIAEEPTVDAVKVVRCADCKYLDESLAVGGWDGSCKYWNTHSTVYSGFCSFGERREVTE